MSTVAIIPICDNCWSVTFGVNHRHIRTDKGTCYFCHRPGSVEIYTPETPPEAV